MASFDLNFPTSFFGLNKKDVRKCFEELEKEQKKVMEELEKKKKQLEREEQKLQESLDEAQKEIVKYEDEIVETPGLPSELISDAYKRTEKTTALINMLADEEAAQLTKKANEKLAEYDIMLDELQESINENKEKIEAILNDVLSLLKANAESVIKKDKKPDYKDELAEPELSGKKVIDLFREKLQENKLSLEKEQRERMTADGTSLDNINKLMMFKKKYASQKDEEDEDELAEVLIGKKKPKDELYDLLNGYDVDDDAYEERAAVRKPAKPGLGAIDRFAFDETEEESPAAGTRPSQTAEGAQAGSETEIKQMRNTLIIGKIAGEDLVDSENNVVIPKGKVLSEEDIALAEAAAKLPELIINMVLPQ